MKICIESWNDQVIDYFDHRFLLNRKISLLLLHSENIYINQLNWFLVWLCKTSQKKDLFIIIFKKVNIYNIKYIH